MSTEWKTEKLLLKEEKLNRAVVCKDKIIYSIIALVLFGVFLAFTYFPDFRKPEKEVVSCVMLGDSILGQERDETSVPALVAERTQMTVLNGALGGTTMGRLKSDVRMAKDDAGLSMYALYKAIVADEFGVQQTVRCRWNGTEYFAEAVDGLEKVDYDVLDVLFIQHCINDYHSGVPIHNQEDPYDPFSYAGALRSVVEGLQERYPDLRIILLTSTYSWYLYHEVQETCEEYNSGYGVLEDYVNAQIQVAEELDVEVIDLYHDLYPHEKWEDWAIYTSDGVHPNEAGRALIADRICTYLETR